MLGNAPSSPHKDGIMMKRKMTDFFIGKTQATHNIEEEESSDVVIEVPALAPAPTKKAKYSSIHSKRSVRPNGPGLQRLMMG